jgi:hypothetical protein
MMYISGGIPGTKDVGFSMNMMYISGGIPGTKDVEFSMNMTGNEGRGI